jgi:hypothetical protein
MWYIVKDNAAVHCGNEDVIQAFWGTVVLYSHTRRNYYVYPVNATTLLQYVYYEWMCGIDIFKMWISMCFENPGFYTDQLLPVL